MATGLSCRPSSTTRLLQNPGDPSWYIFRVEWVVNVLENVLYPTRSGRLFCICAYLRYMTLEEVLGDCADGVDGDSRQLLHFIDQIKGSQVPED